MTYFTNSLKLLLMQKTSPSNVTLSQSFHEIIPSFLERIAELSIKTPAFLAKVAIVSYQLQTVFAQKSTDSSNDFARNTGYAAFGCVFILSIGALLKLLSLCFCKKTSVKDVSYVLMTAGLFGTAVFGLMYLISSAYPDINTKNR